MCAQNGRLEVVGTLVRKANVSVFQPMEGRGHLYPIQIEIAQIKLYVARANHVSTTRFEGFFITPKSLGYYVCTKRTPPGGRNTPVR